VGIALAVQNLRRTPREITEAERFVGGALPNMEPEKRLGSRTPPPITMIARRLAPCCRQNGITRLEIFGSVSRGDSVLGSDVDLIAMFREQPGLEIVPIEKEMSRLLGVPVDLLTFEMVDEMTNPFRKATIERDRRTIFVE